MTEPLRLRRAETGKARFLRDRGVEGSNPFAPTTSSKKQASFHWPFLLYGFGMCLPWCRLVPSDVALSMS